MADTVQKLDYSTGWEDQVLKTNVASIDATMMERTPLQAYASNTSLHVQCIGVEDSKQGTGSLSEDVCMAELPTQDKEPSRTASMCDTLDLDDSDECPAISAMEESSYIDTVSSTSSGKPLLASVYRKPSHNDALEDTLEEVEDEVGYDDEIVEKLVRRNTMTGIFESPSYVDSLKLGSLETKRLAQVCRSALSIASIASSGKPTLASLLTNSDKNVEIIEAESVTGLPSRNRCHSSIWSFQKDILLLAFGIMISFTAFMPVRNLQSSINDEGGVGLISLTSGYTVFMIGSLMAPFMVKILKPKNTILLAIVFQVIYCFANFYPNMYTLVPSTMLCGYSNALLWVAVTTYMTYKASRCAKMTKKAFEHVMSHFYGLFFMIYTMSHIYGNLLSSVILFSFADLFTSVNTTETLNITVSLAHEDLPPSELNIYYHDTQQDNISLYNIAPDINSSFYTSANMSDPYVICGSRYCHSYPLTHIGNNEVKPILRYILMGSMAAIEVAGFVIIFFFVSPLNGYKTKVACCMVLNNVKSVFHMFTDYRFLLLIPLQLYTGMTGAFLSGDIIKAFVTCPLGVQMVGYIMMIYGISLSLSSYACGRLSRYTGRIVPIFIASILQTGLATMMLLWQPRPGDLTPYVLMISGWGLAEGVWYSQFTSIIGTVFHEKSEEANAGLRFLQGIGITTAYGYAQAVCMQKKLCLTASLAVVSLVGFLIMEVVERRKKKNASDTDAVKV